MHGDFLLDPDVTYLNHGSYGACARPVFEEYQRLQVELERQPTDFFVRRAFTSFWGRSERPGTFDEARAALASFLGARAEDLVFVPNATSGLNAVLRSLAIRPEEEILTTKHEYGAILRTLEAIRANVVACEPEDIVSKMGVRTRAILVSHVTSPSALVLPVEEICAAARAARVLSIVDGAHAPGQVPVDLDELGADVYAGNCHKWLGAPKGAGFLWARPEHQDWIEPVVVSWGYREDASFSERHGWQGTRDLSAYLAVPKAIEAWEGFDREGMRALADEAERRLGALRLRRVAGEPAPFMRAFVLPPGEANELWQRLWEEHRVEVPVYEWEGRRVLRVSIGPYNDEVDLDRLVEALRSAL